MTPLADYFKSLPVLDSDAPWVDGQTLMDGHLMIDRRLGFSRAGVLFVPWDSIIAHCSFYSGANSAGSPTVVILPKKLSREVFGRMPADVLEIGMAMMEIRGPLG
ncbi:MAG: hypothetical protein ACEQSU_16630 [Microgenomates group bacterium]